MSENEPKFEQARTTENLANNEQTRKVGERELTNSEKQHGSTEQLEKLQKIVEQQSLSKKELAHSEREQPEQHPVLIRKDIKEIQFHRAMTRVRKKLSAPSRVFSRVVHISAVDKSSEFIGKTVARPSGMLAGAVLAFIGTSALLWITKHYGYEYNYLLVIVLFVGGLILGTAAEGLWRLLRKK